MQIHHFKDANDLHQIEGSEGHTRHLLAPWDRDGPLYWLTGPHDPAVMLNVVINGDVDTLLQPVNPVEAVLEGSIDRVIPTARERGIAVIGMKVLGAHATLSSPR